MNGMKTYKVTYKSRYYPLEGNYTKKVVAISKQSIRNNWHELIHTDEYKIVKIEEV